MTFSEKISSLRELIFNSLTPLISDSYVLWDLPYYSNIGDTLIWEGTECFLESLPAKCLSRCAYLTFSYKPLPAHVTILLQGGGNFGDLWRVHQEFRLKVIKLYPNNRIIILPQTVYYNDVEILKEDAKIMGTHPDLTICARDTKSLEILNTYFYQNKLLLLPDMAFCIGREKLKAFCGESISKVLYLKRSDLELSEKDYGSYVVEEKEKIDIKDWPTINSNFFHLKVLGILKKLGVNKIVNHFAFYCLKLYLIKKGVGFLGRYEKIYTTRLHVAILSILLDKPFVFFNNSYGKNKLFYETWLKDMDNAHFID